MAHYPRKTFDNRHDFRRWVKTILKAAGENPQPAVEDRGGNCIICGEAGRCPGWHTLDDIDEMQVTIRRNQKP